MSSPTDTTTADRSQDEEVRAQVVQTILDKYEGRRGGLIAILEEIQARYGYLPQEALRQVSESTGRSLVDIYGVATFYRSFSLEPRGKHLCSVCTGTACHVRGAPTIVQEFERQLDTPAGHSTADGEFTLETVACLGACALGPIVVVDGHYFSKVNTGRIKSILKQAQAGFESVKVKNDRRIFPVSVSCSRCNHTLMDPEHPIDECASIRVTVSFDGHHGWLRLSSLYGSYASESEHHIPPDTLVDVFCPHCHAELRSASRCPECDAPMVSMIVRAGGIIQICSRRGCPGHMLDLNGSAF